MFRLSLLVCVSLLFYGVMAMPGMGPWIKADDIIFQETWIGDGGEMPEGLEQVEPPEDLGVADYDVDPDMAIWKNMRDGGQEMKHLEAEQDDDDLYHPSVEQGLMEDVLRVQPQPEDTFPGTDIQAEPLEDGDHPRFYEAAEEDRDGMYHPERVEGEAGAYQVVAPEPEELTPLGGQGAGGVHAAPEEDRDDLYHADPPPAPVPDREVVVPPAEPADWVAVRMYGEPEEDLDHLYHP